MKHYTRPNRRLLVLWGVIMSAVIAAACAPAAPPSPTAAPTSKPSAPGAAPATSPPAAAKPKTLEKFRLGATEPNWGGVFKYMAEVKGLFREEGLDIEISNVNTPSRLNALVAGQLDAADSIGVAGLAAIDKGADLLFVANGNYPNDMLFVRPGIAKVEDLVGKKLGVNTLGSPPHRLFSELLRKYKIDPQQASFVVIGDDAARLAALVAGQVDATTASVANVQRIEQAGFKALLAFGQELTNFANTPTVVQGKMARERPELVEALLTAQARGIRYGIEHPDETATVAMTYMKETDRNVAVRTVNDLIRFRTASANLLLTPEQLDLMQEQNIEAKQQTARLPLEKIANLEIRKRAIEKIGPYPGWN